VLYRMEKLIGLSIRASDGELGKVQDVYFDDHRRTARYLVVDAAGIHDHPTYRRPHSTASFDSRRHF
jgi:sporulation protein YlmC with PRC-barrel domain